MVFAISSYQLALVTKFLTLEILGINVSIFETARLSIFGYISKRDGTIL
jgi:hypothetical protein